jgi:hypothetical protein
MKKYIIALLVLCLIEGLSPWYNAAQPKMLQGCVTTAIELQTADGPAYLVCIDTIDNSDMRSAFISPQYQMRNLSPDKQTPQILRANLLPEPITVALLAFCGYLLGSRRR